MQIVLKNINLELFVPLSSGKYYGMSFHLALHRINIMNGELWRIN